MMRAAGTAIADALLVVAAAGTVAVQTVVRQPEPMIAGAAQSLMMSAVIGSMIGVWLHQRNTREPVLATDGFGWRLVAGLLWRAGSWGVGVLGFAFLAAWTVTAYCLWKYQMIPAPAPPLTGVLGAFIIPLLPKYQALIEGIADQAGKLLARMVGKHP